MKWGRKKSNAQGAWLSLTSPMWGTRQLTSSLPGDVMWINVHLAAAHTHLSRSTLMSRAGRSKQAALEAASEMCALVCTWSDGHALTLPLWCCWSVLCFWSPKLSSLPMGYMEIRWKQETTCLSQGKSSLMFVATKRHVTDLKWVAWALAMVKNQLSPLRGVELFPSLVSWPNPISSSQILPPFTAAGQSNITQCLSDILQWFFTLGKCYVSLPWSLISLVDLCACEIFPCLLTDSHFYYTWGVGFFCSFFFSNTFLCNVFRIWSQPTVLFSEKSHLSYISACV